MASTDKITYTVRKNGLSEHLGLTEQYYAHVIRSNRTIDHDGIVKEMAEMNMTVSAEDIRIILNQYKETIIRKLQMGYTVNTNMFNAFVGINGTFVSEEEVFSPVKHSLKVHVNPVQSLSKDVEKNAELRKVDADPAAPVIRKFYDFLTQSTNSVVSTGYIGELTGKNFELDPDREDHGIWFENVSTKETSKVSVINRCSSVRIMFKVPENLAAGNYTISLYCGKTVKPKKAEFQTIVMVEEQAAA